MFHDPNPFNNYFSIDNLEGTFELKLTDSQGRKVYTIEGENSGESLQVDQLGKLPAGIYFLNVKSISGNFFSKIVKAE